MLSPINMRIHGCPGFIAVFTFERLNDICMLDERAAMAIEHGGIPFRDAGMQTFLIRLPAYPPVAMN